MKKQGNSRSRVFTFFAGIIVISIIGCNKGDSPTEPIVDPSLNGVWYSSEYSVGFEIKSDGSSKTLVVDTAGKLQYNPPGGEVNTSLILSITKAKEGNLMCILRYKQPGIDTTRTIPGTYILSVNSDTLSVTIPDPSNIMHQITIVFIRAAIGEIVKPEFYPRMNIGISTVLNRTRWLFKYTV
jgi:hypothetical protein